LASVKGTAVDASLRYVRERFGEAALAAILGALPAEDRAALGPGVLASSWYPMDAFLRFMQEAERQVGPQEPDVVRRMGRTSSEYSLKGVYKVFFKFGSPEFIISRAAGVFGSYYDTGEMTVVDSAAKHAVIELAAFAGAPQFCERVYGWMERTLELAGARKVELAHSACVHRGDALCRYEATWD
jgi:uncharacterized protein (TIGR02265 family)